MGSGFKDWAAGDVLTAADVDGYLMRQTAMTFADSSARDTALSGVLDEGMIAYLEDVDQFTFYNGSGWSDVTNGRSACVLPSTSVSISSGTATTALFATEDYDPLGWHSTATNTGRITPSVAGYYLATAQVQNINGPGTNMRALAGIDKNGGGSIARFDVNNYAPDDFSIIGVTEMNGTTDYLEVVLNQFSGVTRTPDVAFSVILVAR